MSLYLSIFLTRKVLAHEEFLFYVELFFSFSLTIYAIESQNPTERKQRRLEQLKPKPGVGDKEEDILNDLHCLDNLLLEAKQKIDRVSRFTIDVLDKELVKRLSNRLTFSSWRLYFQLLADNQLTLSVMTLHSNDDSRSTFIVRPMSNPIIIPKKREYGEKNEFY